jgi:hypothetical protein
LYIQTLDDLVEAEQNEKKFHGARYQVLTYIKQEKLGKYEESIEETLGYEYALLE